MTRNSGGGWPRANVVDLAAPAVTQQWRRARPPFVLINMAMTADGKIATANRAVSSFGSRRDVAHLYELRATVDAVMCGARTAAAGEVHLDAGGPRYQRQRLKRGLAEFNLRVVVSGSGSLPATLPLFQKRFSPIIVLTTRRAGRRGLRRLAAAADEVVICGERHLDLAAALRWLTARWGVRRLLCEGGGELNAAMFKAGLVDELHLTICPLVFGGQEAPTIASGEGAKVLADATRLELQRCRRVGDELFCVFAVRPRKVSEAGDCPAPARRLSSRARKQ
ncbi:MAG: dihydrofolate reductase family protein [Verrucomicrobia bacterium]|jgi:riboflavin-specific deaminase-like protein|nr:dihydrofolate reductase family protein [Verrucomicrobiota bacterium]